MNAARRDLAKSARALLTALASENPRSVPQHNPQVADILIAADLIQRDSSGALAITDVGRARLLRDTGSRTGTIDPFRAQHLRISRQVIQTSDGCADVMVDEAESPLGWLARRRGRNGEPLIQPVQFQAGERLRTDFTHAQLAPRVTSNWDANAALGDGAAQLNPTDVMVTARTQVQLAMDAVGPEFSGLLLDVCCFLKGLEDVERERRWPHRSAKVVLQLGLDRLARHYGLKNEARGRPHAPIRMWAEAGSELPAGS